jgi:hypothetical protein
MFYPIIHTIADAIGHVDLNETRVVFGTPDNMLPNPDDYPDADCRGLVIAKHRDHPVATPDEFVAIVDALIERWPDRPIYLMREGGLDIIYAGWMH